MLEDSFVVCFCNGDWEIAPPRGGADERHCEQLRDLMKKTDVRRFTNRMKGWPIQSRRELPVAQAMRLTSIGHKWYSEQAIVVRSAFVCSDTQLGSRLEQLEDLAAADDSFEATITHHGKLVHILAGHGRERVAHRRERGTNDSDPAQALVP